MNVNSLFIVVSLTVFLSACTNIEHSQPKNVGQLSIDVKNNTDFAYKAFQLNLYQDHKLTTSPISTFADGTTIQEGDIMDFTFTKEEIDFNKKVDIEVVMYVDNTLKKKVVTNKVEITNIKQERDLTYKITGHSSEDIRLIIMY